MAYLDTTSLVSVSRSGPTGRGGIVSGSVYIQNIISDYITLSVYIGDVTVYASRSSLQIVKVGDSNYGTVTGIGWHSSSGMLTYQLYNKYSSNASYGTHVKVPNDPFPFYSPGWINLSSTYGYVNTGFYYFPLSRMNMTIIYNQTYPYMAGPAFTTSKTGSFSYGTFPSTRANLYFPSTGIYQINFTFQVTHLTNTYGCINFKYNPQATSNHALHDTNTLVAAYSCPSNSFGGIVSGSVYIQNTETDYITLSVYAASLNFAGPGNCLQIIKVGEGTTSGDTGIGWFSRNSTTLATYYLVGKGSSSASYGNYNHGNNNLGTMATGNNTFWYFPISSIQWSYTYMGYDYNPKGLAPAQPPGPAPAPPPGPAPAPPPGPDFPLIPITVTGTITGPAFHTSVSGSFKYGTTDSTRANLYFPSTGIYQINFHYQISIRTESYGCINFNYNPTTPHIQHAYQDTNSLVAVYYSPNDSYGGCVTGSVCITDINKDYITLSVFALAECSVGSMNSLQIIKVGENKIVY
jgi:hypothetical protein